MKAGRTGNTSVCKWVQWKGTKWRKIKLNIPEIMTVAPASITPLFGRTQYLRGAVVFTLKHTLLSEGFFSLRLVVTTSVKGPEGHKETNKGMSFLVAFVVWCCALEVKKYVINVIFKLLLLSWKYTRTMRPPSESRIFPHYQPQNMLQQLQLNQLHAYREASEKERENLIQRLTPPSSDNKQTSVFQALISKESFKLISGTLTGYNSIRPMWLRQEIE